MMSDNEIREIATVLGIPITPAERGSEAYWRWREAVAAAKMMAERLGLQHEQTRIVIDRASLLACD